jgi:hypothetical protein
MTRFGAHWSHSAFSCNRICPLTLALAAEVVSGDKQRDEWLFGGAAFCPEMYAVITMHYIKHGVGYAANVLIYFIEWRHIERIWRERGKDDVNMNKKSYIKQLQIGGRGDIEVTQFCSYGKNAVSALPWCSSDGHE